MSPCPCSKRHSPPVTEAEIDLHHSPAQSWPLAPGAVRRVDHLCANTHRRVHHLFNLYVHAGGEPAAAVLRQFKPLELELAAYAWANADHSGPGHLPYTLADGSTIEAGDPIPPEFLALLEAA